VEDKIYLAELESYQYATEEQKRRFGKNPCFDLTRLPTQTIREEMRAYILSRSREITIVSLYDERKEYNRLCRFLEKKGRNVESLKEKEREQWIRRLKGWMMSEGIPLTKEEKSAYGNKSLVKSEFISFFERVLDSLLPEDERSETEKDVWQLDRLDIEIKENLIKKFKTLNFTSIFQKNIREEVKRATYFQLQAEAISSVARELTAMRRLSKYLRQKYPEIQSCRQIDRELMEEYLIYLKTEDTSTKHFHSELTRLRALLEAVGKICRFPQLENLILTRDIPPTPKAEFKTYSDAELKRLNAFLVKMDEQTARLMIIHQMLGTRISDTLTLRTDCLREIDGSTVIWIKQMKTHPYEKEISGELAELIRKAMDYTRERFGETEYIFVNEKNPARPLQYSTVQARAIRMIHKEDIRDDEGNLFGFGSHMYRHYYGVKLTEMHLDDWTIAKLLGHSSVKNVKYYRKMSNQLLADETRRARHRLSELILENLDGWGEEYEQVRYDDSLE
jgi:Site-specific recombinase XerD